MKDVNALVPAGKDGVRSPSCRPVYLNHSESVYDQVGPLAPWIAGAIASLVPWQVCGGVLSAWEVSCDPMCGNKIVN